MSPSKFHAGRSPLSDVHHERPATSDHSVDAHDSDASGDDEATAIPDEQRCKYPGKFCGRARACKSNGTFHRFCQYHRDKANTNQKRWTSVRRQQAAQEAQHKRIQELAAQGYFAPASQTVGTIDAYAPSLLPHPVEFKGKQEAGELTPEDVGILHALLGTGGDPANPATGAFTKHTMHEAHMHTRAFEWSSHSPTPQNYWYTI